MNDGRPEEGRDAASSAPRPKPSPPPARSAKGEAGAPGAGSQGAQGSPGDRGGRGTRGDREPHGASDAGGDAPSRAPRKRRRRRRRRGSLPNRAIVFVGPMAAGKTSLGKRVARELGVPFIDTDAVIVREHGPITEFFAAHGEEEFRRVEAAVIAAELAEPGTRIVALGGGAVLTESTRALLAGHPVVLLMTTQGAVLRTANLSRRPLLRDDPQAWGRILEQRRPLYEAVADVTYRTDRATKEQLAKRIAQWARSYRKRLPEPGGTEEQ